MQTSTFVALAIVLCVIQADATYCISRKKFAEFKENVLNHIQNLTLENDKQAKQIQYQKKAILDLKRLLAENDEALPVLNPEDSAMILNRSLPQEQTRSFKLIPVLPRPQEKRAVKSMFILISFKVHNITIESVILRLI